MKKLLKLSFMAFFALAVMPAVLAVSIGSGVGVDIVTEDFAPQIWGCDNRVVYDDSTEPGRITTNIDNPLYASERGVIADAADRIIDLQDAGGSWDWIVTNQNGSTGTTYRNIAGVTAEVLLDAYELTSDSKYLDAAKDAGDYLLGFSVSDSNRYNAFNMVFLYHLSDFTGDVQYKNHADAILDHVLNQENYWSLNNGNHCADDAIDGCAASELLDALKDFRSWSTDPSGIVVWDLFHFVEAAQRGGEAAFATDMANELDTYMSQAGFNDTIEYYILGLSGGIIALGNAGLDYSSYLADLLAEQNLDGSFSSDQVQGTAYALMALEYASETEAAENAADYLVNNFGYSGYDGWLESDNNEYSEGTSEAAQALFDYVNRQNDELFERINNYAFEGEQIKWTVLVMDKNGVEKIRDVFATIGASQGAGNDIEVNCQETWYGGLRDQGYIMPSCNARILEEQITEWDENIMKYYDCTLTVETPESMYGEHWITVEAEDLDGLSSIMDENEYWFLNPEIALSIEGDLMFEDVRPGTASYSETLLIGNDADEGSGVLLDMFISGTDFYDSSSSGAMCPDTNQLSLSAFSYYATNGAYNSAMDANIDTVDFDRATDAEGYTNIEYGIGFNDPSPFYNNAEILQAGPDIGPYYAANILAPGAEQALTFKLNLPEPCNGDFDSGQIYFWGEAI